MPNTKEITFNEPWTHKKGDKRAFEYESLIYDNEKKIVLGFQIRDKSGAAIKIGKRIVECVNAMRGCNPSKLPALLKAVHHHIYHGDGLADVEEALYAFKPSLKDQ